MMLAVKLEVVKVMDLNHKLDIKLLLVMTSVLIKVSNVTNL